MFPALLPSTSWFAIKPIRIPRTPGLWVAIRSGLGGYLVLWLGGDVGQPTDCSIYRYKYIARHKRTNQIQTTLLVGPGTGGFSQEPGLDQDLGRGGLASQELKLTLILGHILKAMFGPGMADWLNNNSKMRTKCAVIHACTEYWTHSSPYPCGLYYASTKKHLSMFQVDTRVFTQVCDAELLQNAAPCTNMKIAVTSIYPYL